MLSETRKTTKNSDMDKKQCCLKRKFKKKQGKKIVANKKSDKRGLEWEKD